MAGGNDDNTSAELYHPTTGAWRPAGNLVAPRRHHTATLLRSGTVLAIGGACRSSFFPQHAVCAWAEVYNGAPGAPTGVTATAGNASATVSWTAPPDGGSRIASYTATSSPGGITTTVGGSSATATVTGLTNGTAYRFTVRATNAVGTGPASEPSNEVRPNKGGKKR